MSVMSYVVFAVGWLEAYIVLIADRRSVLSDAIIEERASLGVGFAVVVYAAAVPSRATRISFGKLPHENNAGDA